jgi:hypothetical protein
MEQVDQEQSTKKDPQCIRSHRAHRSQGNGVLILEACGYIV